MLDLTPDGPMVPFQPRRTVFSQWQWGEAIRGTDSFCGMTGLESVLRRSEHPDSCLILPFLLMRSVSRSGALILSRETTIFGYLTFYDRQNHDLHSVRLRMTIPFGLRMVT